MPEEQPAADLTARDLATYVGASPDDEHVAACLEQARTLVDTRVGTSTVPVPVLHRAYMEVGAELYWRRTAPNGIRQYASPDGGGAMRVARDPMVAAYPLLAPFLPLGFA